MKAITGSPIIQPARSKDLGNNATARSAARATTTKAREELQQIMLMLKNEYPNTTSME